MPQKNEHVLIAFYVLETILGARNTEVNNTKSSHSSSLHSENIAPTCPIEENTQGNILSK